MAILFYHGICDDRFVHSDYYDPMHLPRSMFRRQLAYLQRHGYKFVSLSRIVDALTGNDPIRDRLVTLTFDDGFRNVVRNAYPLMLEFEAKGCIYVVSEFTGTDQVLWVDWLRCLVNGCRSKRLELPSDAGTISLELGSSDLRAKAVLKLYRILTSQGDEARRCHLERWQQAHAVELHDEYRLCSWEEIQGLDPSVMEIGSHTCSHPCLTRVADPEILRWEVVGSKLTIEARLGRRILHFCYPAGDYDKRVVDMVAAAGYASAATIRPSRLNRRGGNPLLLTRVQTGGGLTGFKSSLSGSLELLSRTNRSYGPTATV